MKKVTVLLALTVSSVGALSACQSASPDASPVGERTVANKFQIPSRVTAEGALAAPYSARSLGEFARSGFVTRIVKGTVANVQTVVTADTAVFTEVTIRVDNPGAGESEVLVTRETGGVVTLGQVREDFEGRVPEEVLDAEADRLIEYAVAGGAPHSEVGQQVFAFLGGDPNAGGYFTAASLVKAKDSAFQWPGSRPNPAWETSVTAQTAQELALKK